MSEEIKEILYLQNYVEKYKSDEKAIIKGNRLTTPAMLDYLEVKALLDYITNLQQKVEQLVLEIEQLRTELNTKDNIINELEEELDRGYRDLFDMELVPGRELILNIKNYLKELKENK